MHLAELQDVIERTFGERDRARGVPATVAWLAEEVGELAQAVRKGSHEQRVHEFGDVIAWDGARGLAQIENPSQVMLEGRPIGISGTCVACVMEGTRPVLSEIQALATKTSFPSPRRTASGFDYNRMYLLLAVLEKRAGYAFYNQDVYINIIGGLKLDETACDLPVCIALASSLLDLPVDEKTIAIGEVGLGGEVRSVTHLETRLREAQRVGFDTAIVPKHNLKMIDPSQFPGLKLVGVSYLREAINAIKLK